MKKINNKKQKKAKNEKIVKFFSQKVLTKAKICDTIIGRLIIRPVGQAAKTRPSQG